MDEYVPIGSWVIDYLSEPEQYFEVSKSYANASLLLCRSITDDTYGDTWTNGMVILSLSFHSYELFLKGAIIHKNTEVKNTHRIDILRQTYDSLYLDKQYDIPRIFRVENFTDNENTSQELYKKIHQQLRYPRDAKGNLWSPQGFNALLYIFELNEYIKRINQTIPIILQSPGK